MDVWKQYSTMVVIVTIIIVISKGLVTRMDIHSMNKRALNVKFCEEENLELIYHPYV